MVIVRGDRVEFRFFRPQARHVDIVGDFNDWQTGQLTMRRAQDGYWVAEMALPAGSYHFRYRADGEWFTDYAAFGIEQGLYGMDSVVRVTCQVREQTQPQAEQFPS